MKSEPIDFCPFCNNPLPVVHKDESYRYYVVCGNCHARGPSQNYREQAVKAWGFSLDGTFAALRLVTGKDPEKTLFVKILQEEVKKGREKGDYD